jgi:DNA polymerase III delta prime subunit
MEQLDKRREELQNKIEELNNEIVAKDREIYNLRNDGISDEVVAFKNRYPESKRLISHRIVRNKEALKIADKKYQEALRKREE